MKLVMELENLHALIEVRGLILKLYDNCSLFYLIKSLDSCDFKRARYEGNWGARFAQSYGIHDSVSPCTIAPNSIVRGL